MARPDNLHPDIVKWSQRAAGISSSGDVKRQERQTRRFRPLAIEDPDSHPIYPLGVEVVTGFQRDTAATAFNMVSSRGYCRYIGRAIPRLSSIDIGWRVQTVGSGITYAEIAIATSEEPEIFPTDQYFQTVQSIDIALSVLSAARKITTFSDFEQINVGAHLWVWIVVQGTPPVLRGGVPAECGLLMEKSGSARPSVNSGSTGWSEVSTAKEDVWLVVKQRQA
jgi:hypothetical protein